MTYIPELQEFLATKYKLNSRRKYVLKYFLNPDTYVSQFDSRKNFMNSLANWERSDGIRGNQQRELIISNSIYQLKNGKVPIKQYKEGQWIGVEIECTIPVFNEHTSEPNYNTRKAKCFETLTKLLDAQDMKYVDVKHDGSIEADDGEYDSYFCVELTVCFIRTNGYSRLEKLCNLLNSLGAKVNRSCGLHVHLDMRGQKKEEVELQGTKLVNALPVLAKFVPKTRWDESNTYCKINSNFSLSDSNKYRAINSVPYKSFKTLEVRLHSSTTNAQKIINWIELLCSIKEYKGVNAEALTRRRIAQKPTIWFMEAIDLDKDLQRFYLQREAQFDNPNVTPSQMAPEVLERSSDGIAARTGFTFHSTSQVIRDEASASFNRINTVLPSDAYAYNIQANSWYDTQLNPDTPLYNEAVSDALNRAAQAVMNNGLSQAALDSLIAAPQDSINRINELYGQIQINQEAMRLPQALTISPTLMSNYYEGYEDDQEPSPDYEEHIRNAVAELGQREDDFLRDLDAVQYGVISNRNSNDDEGVA